MDNNLHDDEYRETEGTESESSDKMSEYNDPIEFDQPPLVKISFYEFEKFLRAQEIEYWACKGSSEIDYAFRRPATTEDLVQDLYVFDEEALRYVWVFDPTYDPHEIVSNISLDENTIPEIHAAGLEAYIARPFRSSGEDFLYFDTSLTRVSNAEPILLLPSRPLQLVDDESESEYDDVATPSNSTLYKRIIAHWMVSGKSSPTAADVEKVLQQAGANPRSGVFVTPAYIAEAMVKLVPPDLGPARILDLAAGTGMLLLAANERFPDSQKTGVELIENLVDIARIFSELPINPTLQYFTGDSRDIVQTQLNSFDLVLLDPPFGDLNADKTAAIEIDGWKVQTLEDLMLMRGLEYCRPGGIVISIVPDRFLIHPNSRQLRAHLLSNHQILSIIHLERTTFASDRTVLVSESSVPTSIVVLRKGVNNQWC